MQREKIILGIDPGTTIMGYGIIKVLGNDPDLIAMGILELHKYKDPYLKLQRIFDRTIQLINDYPPDEMAIEAPFYGKNVQSMLKLGRAQGVAISAALSRSIPIFEYAPKKIKMAITGKGSASKEQVANMLKYIFKLEETPSNLDATDGLAAALCHFYQCKKPLGEGTKSSWKAFIKNNPGRVRL